jgi:LysR family transcriptional regulator, transcriptional activator of nhaA
VEWLNYHHLLYFWMVAREGTIAKAGEKLSLAQPTISGQLRALEEALDQKLFVRSGRHLVLTESGRLVFSYADEIFGIGRELLETLKGKRSPRRPARLMIGVVESVPNLIAHLLLAPIWRLSDEIQVICRDDTLDRLLASLALHELDAVLADAPAGSTSRVRAFSHKLGDSPLGLFGVSALSARYRRRFPHSLDRAPLCLPSPGSPLRRGLDDWFHEQQLSPNVRAESSDVDLLNIWGYRGKGLIPAPVALQRELRRRDRVLLVGVTPIISEYYVISSERRLEHPAVAALTAAGRQLFT